MSDPSARYSSEEESSSDEFLKDPSTLVDEDFNIPELVNRDFNNDSVELAKLPSTQDNGSSSAYFDFSQIIKTQQALESSSLSKCSRAGNESITSAKRSVELSESELKFNVTDLLALGECAPSSLGEDSYETSESSSEDVLPLNNVEITIPISETNRREKSSYEAALRRKLNAANREKQHFLHKVHLLCLIAHGNYINEILNSTELLAIALSLIPSDKFYPPKFSDLNYLQKLVEWFSKKVEVKNNANSEKGILDTLIKCFECRKANSINSLVYMFISILRALGLKSRLIISLQPIPLKPSKSSVPSTLNFKAKDQGQNIESSKLSDPGTTTGNIIPSKIGNHSISSRDSRLVKAERSLKKCSTNKHNPLIVKVGERENKFKKGALAHSTHPQKLKKKSQIGERLPRSKSTTVDDHKMSFRKKSVSVNSTRKKLSRKVLSSESEGEGKSEVARRRKGVDVWVEAFVEAEEKWISVDVSRASVHCVQELYSNASHPVSYVLGWNSDNTIKDLTRRYDPKWLTNTRKLRVDPVWFNKTILPWKPRRSAMEKEEDRDLDRLLEEKPLPSSISEYKNHPLYVLKRHLLKFEAIYPPEVPPLGYVRGEAVYSRLSVCELHSRETWMRKAKLVRVDESAYKVVKSRPKFDKISGAVIHDAQLELFGHWQVDDYIPPPVVDGKLPRNEYGNIELYKPCMLPKGSVHLQLPGLNRVAKKLDIDCAPAVIGWEFHSGGSHPVFDGFIVCEEFKDTLLDAWNVEMDESSKRSKEKLEKRVYGNWRRLIRGLLIRERLKKKYNFGASYSYPKPDTDEGKNKKRRFK